MKDDASPTPEEVKQRLAACRADPTVHDPIARAAIFDRDFRQVLSMKHRTFSVGEMRAYGERRDEEGRMVGQWIGLAQGIVIGLLAGMILGAWLLYHFTT